MATVQLRNTNPVGDVDLPLIGRQGEQCLKAGEVFEIDADLAGAAPSGDPASDDYDPGHGLLAQVGNYELVTDTPKTSKAKPATD